MCHQGWNGAELTPFGPSRGAMELTTAAELRSPVDNPFNFRNVRSGVKEAENEAP